MDKDMNLTVVKCFCNSGSDQYQSKRFLVVTGSGHPVRLIIFDVLFDWEEEEKFESWWKLVRVELFEILQFSFKHFQLHLAFWFKCMHNCNNPKIKQVFDIAQRPELHWMQPCYNYWSSIFLGWWMRIKLQQRMHIAPTVYISAIWFPRLAKSVKNSTSAFFIPKISTKNA